jgi:uncharacterized protein YceK
MIGTARGICIVLIVLAVGGCATVDVTKTAKGFFSATRAADIEILMTRPDQAYTELATISTMKWKPSNTAKMHNALRAKTAPLGAHAVIIMDSGIVRGPWNSQWLWTSGAAIRYKDPKEPLDK